MRHLLCFWGNCFASLGMLALITINVLEGWGVAMREHQYTASGTSILQLCGVRWRTLLSNSVGRGKQILVGDAGLRAYALYRYRS